MRTRPRYEQNHSAEQLDCSVYLISVLDWRTDYRTICEKGYIGETGTMPFIRFMEHLYDQEFGDVIVGMPRILQVCASKAEVLAAEKAAVEEHLPQMNHEWQPPGNPNRVPIFDQKRMREERNAARAAGKSIHDIGHAAYQLGGKPGYVPRSRRKAEPHPVNAGAKPHARPPRRAAPAPAAPTGAHRRTAVQFAVAVALWWLVLVPAVWVALWWLVDVLGHVGLPPELGASAGASVGFVLARLFVGRR